MFWSRGSNALPPDGRHIALCRSEIGSYFSFNHNLLVILAIVGFGFGMFSSPNTNAIMGSVDKKYLGIASATVGTMRMTGQMMSMGIATLILQLFIGNRPVSAQYSAEFMSSMKATFMVFVVLCIVGVFASLARGKATEEKNKRSQT